MLKTYSIKGNTVIVPFSVKTATSIYKFDAPFTGGDTEALGGKKKRAVYKTKNSMEQFAIEESEMFKKGIVTLDDCVDTPAEALAKAKAAARREAAEQDEDDVEKFEDLRDTAPKKKTTKK